MGILNRLIGIFLTSNYIGCWLWILSLLYSNEARRVSSDYFHEFIVQNYFSFVQRLGSRITDRLLYLLSYVETNLLQTKVYVVLRNFSVSAKIECLKR